MRDALTLLARLPGGESGAAQVAALLAHFWENRALARSLLQGTALRAVGGALIGHVEAALERRPGDMLFMPRRLAAHALAHSLLSPVIAWLSGEAACDAAHLAAALGKSSQAALAGMLASPD